jgi:hypothetical protein
LVGPPAAAAAYTSGVDLRSSGRCLILCAVTLVTVAMAAGCGAASTRSSADTASAKAPARAGTALTFHNDFLAFRYPPSWKPYRFDTARRLHFHPMVYVGTQPGHDPCRQSQTETTCGWPVDRLRPNGVLIAWENNGWPGWSLASVTGKALKVGGRAGKISTARPGGCSAIGADETVEVVIERPMRDNWTGFTACLRGPNLPASERAVYALLTSTRFLAP